MKPLRQLRPRTAAKQAVSLLPYPDGDPTPGNPLEWLLYSLDKQEFSAEQVMAVDDKMVHALLDSKGRSQPEFTLHNAKLTLEGLDHQQGLLLSRIYNERLPPETPMQEP